MERKIQWRDQPEKVTKDSFVVNCKGIEIPPIIAFESLVGISDNKYPLSFGNYFGFSNPDDPTFSGIYCVNMWAENLREIKKRLNLETIEILRLTSEKDRPFCFVKDERIPEDWLNDKICYTGCMHMTMLMKATIFQLAGLPTDNEICGCEKPDGPVSISMKTKPGSVIDIDGDGDKWEYCCSNCNRKWIGEKR